MAQHKLKTTASSTAPAGRRDRARLVTGAVALRMEILEAMAAGRGVTIIPENAALSTVQAAEV